MTIINSATKKVSIDTIEPHPENPRIGKVDAIVRSIETNGFYGSVIVQSSTNHILAGSHRWKAARQAGLTSIPVTFVDVDDETARRIMLVDNRSSDLGVYDDGSLVALLQSVSALDGTGWTDDDLTDLLKRTNVPTLDELAAKYGEHDDNDPALWPVVKLRVDPQVFAMWTDAIEKHGGDPVVVFAKAVESLR